MQEELRGRAPRINGRKKIGLCDKCLRWPCDFLKDIDLQKEEVTWCKNILQAGDKIELMATPIINGKSQLIAGKKFAVEGIKERKIFEGYFIRIKGKKLFVPKAFGRLMGKKTKNPNKRRHACQN